MRCPCKIPCATPAWGAWSLLTMSHPSQTSEGQLLLDVDDFIEGGKEIHRKTMTSIVVVRRSTSGRQDKRVHASPGGVSCNTPIFASPCRWTNMSNPSSVPLKFQVDTCQTPKDISDGMLTNVKGVNGGLGWLASTARPDMAALHSIIPFGYDRRSPQLISEVNAAVKQCHAVPITITIWPIPFAEVRWTTFTDSGFDTGERQRHQQGWLVCATNKYRVFRWLGPFPTHD